MAKPIDLTGMTFGKLTVMSLIGLNKFKRREWECRCECGNTIPIDVGHLRSGHTQSCGCARGDANEKRCLRHGAARRGKETGEHQSWRAMIRRCTVVDDPKYPSYGGRGIRVCQRWRESFEAFLADMGLRPSPKHTIDRFPDVNGNYDPANCRWATAREQAQNKRDNVNITCNGETLCVAEWERRMGFPEGRIRNRLRLGWSAERAIMTPSLRPKGGRMPAKP